jgi:hypothetical protein
MSFEHLFLQIKGLKQLVAEGRISIETCTICTDNLIALYIS